MADDALTVRRAATPTLSGPSDGKDQSRLNANAALQARYPNLRATSPKQVASNPGEANAATSTQAKTYSADQRGGGEPVSTFNTTANAAVGLGAAVDWAWPQIARGVASETAGLGLGTAAGPLAALPILVVPNNASHQRTGTLPGHPDIEYEHKVSERSISFYQVGSDGQRTPLWSGSKTDIQFDAAGVPQVNVDALRAHQNPATNVDAIMPFAASSGRWTCEARCNVQQIDRNAVCPDRVSGSAGGPSQAEACRAAKRVATQSTPPGCYPRHCQCTWCSK